MGKTCPSRINYAILALILALVFISGCSQQVGSGSSLFTDQYKSDMKRIAISSPDMYETCKVGVCWCMACKNGTSLFPSLGEKDLIGGSCYFQSNCNQQVSTTLSDPTQSPNISIRQFMIGQGPTIYDFSAAQPYCSDGMNMAVQWLVGTKDTPYTMPSAERSMCLLGVDVIPVYVMYSNGTNLNASRAFDIGKELGQNGKNFFQGRLTSGPVGPVIVVTEMDFNISEASQVADEVTQVNLGCGNDRANNVVNCLVAVAPRINDTAALDAVLKLAGPENVDLVAFGVNGHYVHSCDPATINMQVYNFAGYSLYNDSKPTIIPYVMFEPSGTDIDNSCTWDEGSVDKAYSSLSSMSTITALRSRGVIGIAPYAFNSTSSDISNPLGCQNCGVAATDSRLVSWYGNCQTYTSKPDANGKPQHIPGLSITYADQPGGACMDNFQNFNIVAQFQTTYSDAMGNKDIMSPVTSALQAPVQQLYSCSDCINQNASGSPPFAFPVKAGAPPATNCTAIPDINKWAGMRNLDPMFVRAIAYLESSLNPCAAAKVCSASCLNDPSCSQGCFPPSGAEGNSECYNKSYAEMHDPAPAGAEGSCPDFQNDVVQSGQNPRWGWCGLGLMQSVEPPYTFWPDSNLAPGLTPGVDNPYKDVFMNSGFGKSSGSIDPYYPLLVSALSCDPKYNPFDPGDSLCMGTLKLETGLRMGYAWIDQHSTQLGFNNTGTNTEKATIFAYYIDAEIYRGWWGADTRNDFQAASDFPSCTSGESNGNCWTEAFYESRTVTDATCAGQPDRAQCKGGKPNWNPPYYCYGATDFISFVQSCFGYPLVSYSKDADPGATYMSNYYWFNNNCGNSFCPYGKALLNYANNPTVIQPMPASGNPYIPDLPVTSTTTSP